MMVHWNFPVTWTDIPIITKFEPISKDFSCRKSRIQFHEMSGELLNIDSILSIILLESIFRPTGRERSGYKMQALPGWLINQLIHPVTWAVSIWICSLCSRAAALISTAAWAGEWIPRNMNRYRVDVARIFFSKLAASFGFIDMRWIYLGIRREVPARMGWGKVEMKGYW